MGEFNIAVEFKIALDTGKAEMSKNMSHSLWFIVYDRRVFDFWPSLSSVGVLCLICVVEGEFSNDEKTSSVWNHKYESQN